MGSSKKKRAESKNKRDPRSVDEILAKGSSIRSRILNMCTADTVSAASRLSDDWFEAAANKETWRGRLQNHSILASCDPTFDLVSPHMYRMILHLPRQHLSTIQTMSKGNVDEFFPNLGLLTGFPHDVYTVQFPALHVLLRMPEVLQLPPASQPVKEGYALFAPWVMLITSVVRWYKVLGCPGQMVPWLLSVYQWAASTHLITAHNFHKVMLAAPMALLTPTAGIPSALGLGTNKVHSLPPLPSNLVDRLLEITHLVAQRFLRPNFESSYQPDPTIPSTNEQEMAPAGPSKSPQRTPVKKKNLSGEADDTQPALEEADGPQPLSFSDGRKMKKADSNDGTMQILMALLKHRKKKDATTPDRGKQQPEREGLRTSESEEEHATRTRKVNALRHLGMLPATAQIVPHNEDPTATAAREAKQSEIKAAAVTYVAQHIRPQDGMTSSMLRLLGDNDARLIIGIYYHIVRRNPERREEVLGHIVERWGLSGLEEYIASSRRVEYLVFIQSELQGTIHHAAKE